VNLRGLGRRLNRRIAPGHLVVPPEWIVLGVNTICNLHCKMCDVGTGTSDTNFAFHLTGAEPRDMPAPLASRIVGEVAARWPRCWIGYAFTEPTLWPHLAESVAEATRAGVRTSLTTNGLRLPVLAQALADAGLTRVDVSIDGPAAVHDAIRGNRRSFAMASEGLSALAPRTRASVWCTVTEWNAGALTALLDALRDLPLAQVGFMHANYTTDAMAAAQGERWPATPSNVAEHDPARVDRDQLWAQIAEIRSRSWPWPIRFAPETPARADLDDWYLRPERRFSRGCTDAFRALMVKADGEVIPAHGRCFRVPVGNANHTPLADLWNAPALAGFRRDLRAAGGLMPACTRCCSAVT
jgi:MoaA/NifB/PqqE/SkfB family radical SAM enzyme